MNKKVYVVCIAAFITIYLILKYFFPKFYDLISFLSIYANFKTVSFAIPLILLPIPALTLLIIKREKFLTQEIAMRESFVGLISGIGLEIVMFFEALYNKLNLFHAISTLLIGILSICSSIWLTTLIIFLALVKERKVIFKRRKKLRKGRKKKI